MYLIFHITHLQYTPDVYTYNSLWIFTFKKGTVWLFIHKFPIASLCFWV